MAIQELNQLRAKMMKALDRLRTEVQISAEQVNNGVFYERDALDVIDILEQQMVWYDYLPTHWKERIAKEFTADNFCNTVTVRNIDGSVAEYKNAFFLVDEERQELAVFTEHCGYHIWPLGDTQYS